MRNPFHQLAAELALGNLTMDPEQLAVLLVKGRVREHQRRLPNGKVITVKAHDRKGQARSDAPTGGRRRRAQGGGENPRQQRLVEAPRQKRDSGREEGSSTTASDSGSDGSSGSSTAATGTDQIYEPKRPGESQEAFAARRYQAIQAYKQRKRWANEKRKGEGAKQAEPEPEADDDEAEGEPETPARKVEYMQLRDKATEAAMDNPTVRRQAAQLAHVLGSISGMRPNDDGTYSVGGTRLEYKGGQFEVVGQGDQAAADQANEAAQGYGEVKAQATDQAMAALEDQAEQSGRSKWWDRAKWAVEAAFDIALDVVMMGPWGAAAAFVLDQLNIPVVSNLLGGFRKWRKNVIKGAAKRAARGAARGAGRAAKREGVKKVAETVKKVEGARRTARAVAEGAEQAADVARSVQKERSGEEVTDEERADRRAKVGSLAEKATQAVQAARKARQKRKQRQG